MNPKLRWGLLATGEIAGAFARGVRTSQTGELTAVGSRSLDKARAFGTAFGISACHGSYEALLADKNVEAVYISTPHPQHAKWAIRSARAGKHVLVEKPAGLNLREAQAMIQAAADNKVFFLEAYMYRCHPQTTRLVKLVREKIIGEVCVIQATFSFRARFDPASRLWNQSLAGGGILDAGGYVTSITRLVAGAAHGLPFVDPIAVSGAGHLHPETGVDAWAAATLKFPGGIVATASAGVGVDQENVLRIFGTNGSILVPNPYTTGREYAVPGKIIVHRKGEPPREITIPASFTSYAFEADMCSRAIRAGRQQAESPAMTWEDTLGNIRTQEAWRVAIGLTYDAEKLIGRD